MKKGILFGLCLALNYGYHAQLNCAPTFANGCSTWHSNYVVMGGIDWTYDEVDCSFSDYTSEIGTIIAGQNNEMLIESGNWCGASVWVDLNRDGTLDDSENLFHEGNGGSETHLFSFNITVPTTTLNGQYTMRVITSWGSDGFNPGENGSGACGSYQYGNFQDFQVNITEGITSLPELETQLRLAPNPTNDAVRLEIDPSLLGKNAHITDLNGKQLLTYALHKISIPIDLSILDSGLYFLHVEGRQGQMKIIKN